ncbi:GH1 family beta-glucosidase [Streptomyces sp. CT34]|uniref:GH1 family beta-glucosidase n=1 Tax=Streptomyces sp. CT34 TaxID=1553907 RepID=UPI0005BB382F|nr:GH1 family beta-glucosidase [Streptomyces sp. CT34]
MTTQATSTAQQTSRLRFPRGFTWGVATAAYQIEGAVTEDGRAPSIWDTFSHTPGKTRNGDTADVTTDHYHLFAEDVALMADLGVQGYRLSLAWPRICPEGRVNTKGLDFYQRLVDELLAHGIEPWITLYHWDLPQTLEDQGGWTDRQTAHRFADYATTVYAALHDRVGHWLTINEPWCAAYLGYAAGVHAPGVQDRTAAVRAAHHLLVGHGLAVQALRAHDDGNQLGIALNLTPITPASSAPADTDAARRLDGLINRFFLDGVLLGRYPDDVLADLDHVSDLSHIQAEDTKLIAAPLDLLGINYYTRLIASGSGDGEPARPSPWVGAEDVTFVTRSTEVTAMGWEVNQDFLAETLLRVHRDYPAPPLVITENGAAYDDIADPGGDVHDPQRIDYLDRHLRAARLAMSQGVDLRGYFLWSLLDNFEWAEGYSKRFGIVHVDYPSRRRLLKDSARWYAEVIARNGLAETNL